MKAHPTEDNIPRNLRTYLSTINKSSAVESQKKVLRYNEIYYKTGRKSRLNTPLTINGRYSTLHQPKHSTKSTSPHKIQQMYDMFLPCDSLNTLTVTPYEE